MGKGHTLTDSSLYFIRLIADRRSIGYQFPVERALSTGMGPTSDSLNSDRVKLARIPNKKRMTKIQISENEDQMIFRFRIDIVKRTDMAIYKLKKIAGPSRWFILQIDHRSVSIAGRHLKAEVHLGNEDL